MCNVLKNEGDNQEKWPTKQEEHERKTHNNQLEGGRQNMIKVQTGWDSREKNYDCRKMYSMFCGKSIHK